MRGLRPAASENELGPELQGSRAVRVDRMQEPDPVEAVDPVADVSRSIPGSSVARDHVAGRVAAVGVVDHELGVVEGLAAQLQGG